MQTNDPFEFDGNGGGGARPQRRAARLGEVESLNPFLLNQQSDAPGEDPVLEKLTFGRVVVNLKWGNPLIVAGQLHGGVAQGIGQALLYGVYDVASDGFRWVTVGAPGTDLDIVLFQPHGGRSQAEGDALLTLVTQGSIQAAIFRADDLDATFEAVRASGSGLRGDVTLQSVIEEECTGNGALACALRGMTADAAIVTEPHGLAANRATVGVIWRFRSTFWPGNYICSLS